MARVIAYIDGMNLYHGLREKFGRRYLWLDLETMVRLHLRPRQQLVGVQYFTARVRNQPASEQRQQDYLAAIGAQCPRLHVVEGRFQQRVDTCRSCGSQRITYDEKETDVNMAAALVTDAVRNDFDVAILVSADADLVPAVRAARSLAQGTTFVAAFPPRRRSDALRLAVNAAFTLGDAKIRAAQLPDRVPLRGGGTVQRPAYWRGG